MRTGPVSVSNSSTLRTTSAVDISGPITLPPVTDQSLHSSPAEQPADPVPVPSSSNDDPAPVSTYVRPQTPTEATFAAQATPDITDHGTHEHKTENQGSVLLEDHVSAPSTCVTNHSQFPVVAEFKQTPESPFSKYLKYPCMPASSTKKRKASSMPKAITGLQFRKMLQEKREKKEREDQEKLRRKEERLRKKKMKEEQTKLKKQKQLERKRKMMEKRHKNDEKKMLKHLDSDSDDATAVAANLCYMCEKPYGSDFIECEKCFRRFHFDCVQDEMLDDVPFECKFC